jgi:pantothenate kinase
MTNTTIEINQVSYLFSSLFWQKFETENELLEKINEYQDEKNLNNALKSEKIRDSFKTLSSLISSKLSY